jgi:hypothetical protein
LAETAKCEESGSPSQRSQLRRVRRRMAEPELGNSVLSGSEPCRANTATLKRENPRACRVVRFHSLVSLRATDLAPWPPAELSALNLSIV